MNIFCQSLGPSLYRGSTVIWILSKICQDTSLAHPTEGQNWLTWLQIHFPLAIRQDYLYTLKRLVHNFFSTFIPETDWHIKLLMSIIYVPHLLFYKSWHQHCFLVQVLLVKSQMEGCCVSLHSFDLSWAAMSKFWCCCIVVWFSEWRNLSITCQRKIISLSSLSYQHTVYKKISFLPMILRHLKL